MSRRPTSWRALARRAVTLLLAVSLTLLLAPAAPAPASPAPAAPAARGGPATSAARSTAVGGHVRAPSDQARRLLRPGGRPNVVLVMTDDMNVTDLSAMPLTRRLVGRRGVRFTAAVSPNPLCCPARASLLTGWESHNHGVWTNSGPHGAWHALRRGPTLPVWLQRAGYLTGMTGKHLNGYDARRDGRQPGWTWFDPLVAGLYRYTGSTTYADGHPHVVPGYITTYTAAATAAAVRRFEARDDRPFFLWASYVAPHRSEPAHCSTPQTCWGWPIPAARDRRRHAHALPPSLDQASWAEADLSDTTPALSLLAMPRRRDVVREHRDRLRALAAVDRAVARTVRVLRATGELDRTLLVFTSDNGYLLGQHRWVGKVLPYDESLRVPLLVRGPGVPAGRVADQLVTIADLTRTVVALAGARPTHRLDGVPLLRYLRHPGTRDRHPGTPVETGGFGFFWPTRAWAYRGYREGPYTYVRWRGGAVDLWDRSVDPDEVVDRAADPAYADLLAELARRWRATRECVGQACRPDPGTLPVPGADGTPAGRVTPPREPQPRGTAWRSPYLR